MNPQVKTLIDRTTGQHGFWLVNNGHHVEYDLLKGIQQKGMTEMVIILNTTDHPFVNALYKKIDTARESK